MYITRQRFIATSFLPLLVMLLWWHAASLAAPHAVVVMTHDISWDALPASAVPVDAAVGGLSDPAMPVGADAILVTLGAGGRNNGFADGSTLNQSLVHTSHHLRVPPTLWAELRARNRQAFAGAQPGMLGETLRGHGVRTVVVSHPSDQMAGALVAADTHGRLDQWLPWDDAMRLPDFDGSVVFCYLPPRESLTAIEALAARYPATPLLFFSVTPSPGVGGAPRRDDLAPVLLLGRDSGLLESRSTHWTGIISAGDIAPTILALAGIRSPDPTATSLGIVRDVHPAHTMVRLAAQTRASYQARKVLSILWGALLFFISLGIGAMGCNQYRCTHRAWLFAGWTMPALLVLGLPLLWYLPLWVLCVILLGTWLLLALLFARMTWLAAWAVGATIGGGAIALTAITNSLFARQPFLGMAIASGHRFYGVGNEGVGVLLVLLTMLVGITVARQPLATIPVVVIFYGLTAVLLGASWWGANWGGAMASVLTGTLYLLIAFRHRLRWWHAITVPLVLAAIGAGLLIALTLLFPTVSSHTGALGQQILHNGWSSLTTMISRKLVFSWMIWQRSQGWAMTLGGMALGALLLHLHRQAPAKPRYLIALREALWVAWGGAILAGLVNDNGITLTALMWLTSIPAAVALYLDQRAHAEIAAAPAIPVP